MYDKLTKTDNCNIDIWWAISYPVTKATYYLPTQLVRGLVDGKVKISEIEKHFDAILSTLKDLIASHEKND